MSSMIKNFSFLAASALVLLAATEACTERLADCVEVYPNTGATRRTGFTKAACEERCASIQGWLDCYWDGRLAGITEPSVVVTTGREGSD